MKLRAEHLSRDHLGRVGVVRMNRERIEGLITAVAHRPEFVVVELTHDLGQSTCGVEPDAAVELIERRLK